MKLILTLALTFFFLSCSSKQKQGDTITTKTKTANQQSSAAKAGNSSNPLVTCTKGKETRTLEVVADGKGCKLNYTKGGATKSAATSIHGTHYCQKVSDKISKNLTGSGYTCN